jgi:hypothetical protein
MQWGCVTLAESPRQLCNNLLHKFQLSAAAQMGSGQSVDDLHTTSLIVPSMLID